MGHSFWSIPIQNSYFCKKYWYCLLGKELYVYKNKNEDKHKGMHNLIGVFIKDEPEE